MLVQIVVSLVQDRVVARRFDHRRLVVVGHDRLRPPAHVLEAAHMRGARVFDLLDRRRFRIDSPRHSHRGHEHPRLVLDPVDQDRRRHAGVVVEQPYAGAAVRSETPVDGCGGRARRSGRRPGMPTGPGSRHGAAGNLDGLRPPPLFGPRSTAEVPPMKGFRCPPFRFASRSPFAAVRGSFRRLSGSRREYA